jgi:peptidoglycan/LPS O-acetylase OafA/YrhL
MVELERVRFGGEHPSGLGLIAALPDSGTTFLFAGVLLAVTLAIAVLSYYIVELPFLHKKGGSMHRWRRQQTAEQRT